MSALTVEPRNGIRLMLANYFLIRTSQSGGEFWAHENQQIIRQSMGDFLPKAEPDGRKSVLFQHYVDGQEVCSTSIPISESSPLETAELARVVNALQALKQKATDPHCDPNARKFIESFRLPDPTKDPELYRLYGPAGRRKLVILWGLEKEEGSAVFATDAVNRLPLDRNSGGWMKWAAVWVLLLLLGLLLLLFLPKKGEHVVATGLVEHTVPDTSATTPSLTQSKNEPTLLEDSRASGATGTTSPLANEEARLSTGTSTIPDRNLQPALGDPIVPDPGEPADSTAKPLPSTPGISPPSSASATGNPAPGGPAAVSPGKSDPAATGKADPKPLENAPTDPGSEGAAKPPADSTMPKAGDSSVTRKSNTLPNIPPAPLPSAETKGAISKVPSLTGEIVNGRTNSEPKDGKVEMLLSLLARDKEGKPITISKVDKWTVDGQTQSDSAGHPLTSNGLPLRLAEGMHRIGVSGTAEDGRSITAEAEVGVNIAVRQESSVRVKQRFPSEEKDPSTPQKK